MEARLPPPGHFIHAVRSSSREAREISGITVNKSSITRLLFSSAFTSTFPRLRHAHGMQLPLKFPSVLEELNLLSVLSLLNFASGYRVPLYNAVGRGAFDTIRAFVFAMYISAEAEGDYLSAKGMKSIQETKVADLMGVAHKLHQEKQHQAIPGVIIGELGGPVWELVQLVTNVMNETGDILLAAGYPNLGAFVAESFKESDKTKGGANEGVDIRSDVIVERLVRAIPAFRDVALVNGSPIYCFKKALLTVHAVAKRFGSHNPPPFPIPDTSHLPIFSDNVIPSMLVHLGVIDLSTSTPSLGLRDIFPQTGNEETLTALLSNPPEANKGETLDSKQIPKEGPILTTQQAYILRAAAIDACESIVQTARNLSSDEFASQGNDLEWIKEITLPEVDAWLWAVAKDRADYRALERFVLRGTPYF